MDVHEEARTQRIGSGSSVAVALDLGLWGEGDAARVAEGVIEGTLQQEVSRPRTRGKSTPGAARRPEGKRPLASIDPQVENWGLKGDRLVN
jgi:hypothetical protein